MNPGDVISYLEMCTAEGANLQPGMMVVTAFGAFLGALLSLGVGILIESERRPKLSIKIEERLDPVNYTNAPAKRALFVRVRLSNGAMPRCLRWLGRNSAVHCHGEIRFYDHSNGVQVFSKPMPIRWAHSDEPVSYQALPPGQIATVIDPSKFNAGFYRDCHAGTEEPIDVVARFDNDTACYGWNNDAYLKGWRNPDWKLPSGRFLVAVAVYSSGEKTTGVFVLDNSTGIQGFRLMPSTKEDRQKVSVS